MKSTPKNFDNQKTILKTALLDTPLGQMMAIADEKALYLLEFLDQRGVEHGIEKLRIKATIIEGDTLPIISIKNELKSYFEGTLKIFKTPLRLLGTAFQKSVWSELLAIPYGKTTSYAEQAVAVGKQTAYRAVANANGANPIAIVIPCHRIINKNGAIGGYGGGIHRKKWLIEHEQGNKQ